MAPQLKLKTRLTQSKSAGSSSTLSVLGNGTRRIHTQAQTNEKGSVEMPEAVPLLPQEEVIVKDVWNKLRAWKELQMEKFFQRLLLEEPELEYLFGEAQGQHQRILL